MMPVKEYYKGSGKKVMREMQDRYGEEQGKRVFYATANKREMNPEDDKDKKKKKEKTQKTAAMRGFLDGYMHKAGFSKKDSNQPSEATLLSQKVKKEGVKSALEGPSRYGHNYDATTSKIAPPKDGYPSPQAAYQAMMLRQWAQDTNEHWSDEQSREADKANAARLAAPTRLAQVAPNIAGLQHTAEVYKDPKKYGAINLEKDPEAAKRYSEHAARYKRIVGLYDKLRKTMGVAPALEEIKKRQGPAEDMPFHWSDHENEFSPTIKRTDEELLRKLIEEGDITARVGRGASGAVG